MNGAWVSRPVIEPTRRSRNPLVSPRISPIPLRNPNPSYPRVSRRYPRRTAIHLCACGDCLRTCGLWRSPADLWRSPADLWRLPVDLWRSPADLWLSPVDLWRLPVDLWRSPADLWRSPVHLWRSPAHQWRSTEKLTVTDGIERRKVMCKTYVNSLRFRRHSAKADRFGYKEYRWRKGGSSSGRSMCPRKRG